jgi:hypothetical protein
VEAEQPTVEQFMLKFAAMIFLRGRGNRSSDCWNLHLQLGYSEAQTQEFLDEAVARGWLRQSQPYPDSHCYYAMTEEYAEKLFSR